MSGKSVCEKWFAGPNSSEELLVKAEVKIARRRTEVRRGLFLPTTQVQEFCSRVKPEELLTHALRPFGAGEDAGRS